MMNSKAITIIMFVCVLALVNSVSGEVKDANSPSIYLPRHIEIDSDVPSLGQVSIIRGESSFIEKAGKIPLGKLVTPGQTIVVSRKVLLGRLASNGIEASDVKLTGAEEVVIKKRGLVLSEKQFVEFAKAYLAKNPPDKSVCQSLMIQNPKELVLEGAPKNVKFSPRMVATSVRGFVKVEIGVIVDGVKVGSREVSFRLKYSGRKFKTLVDIPAGTLISTDNVKIEKTVLNYPDSSNTTNPYGQIAKRNLLANTEIRAGMVGPIEPPVVFKRNQSIMIRIDKFGLLVTAMGKALEDGRVGQYVKVQNIDSGRTIVAKVNRDGTVEPGI